MLVTRDKKIKWFVDVVGSRNKYLSQKVEFYKM